MIPPATRALSLLRAVPLEGVPWRDVGETLALVSLMARESHPDHRTRRYKSLLDSVAMDRSVAGKIRNIHKIEIN